MPKIAVIVYSAHGHILELAKAEIAGLEAAGLEPKLLRIPSDEPRDASSRADIPEITPKRLATFDGFLIGLPSRYGNVPTAFSKLMDLATPQWETHAFHGKFGGFFVSSGTQGGGQEMVARNTISTLVQHGIIYVPLGYANCFELMSPNEETRGGSAFCAGTFAGSDGSRQPSETELEIAKIQGRTFGETVLRACGNGGPTAELKPVGETEHTREIISPMYPKDPAARGEVQESAPKKEEVDHDKDRKQEMKSDKKFCGCCVVM